MVPTHNIIPFHTVGQPSSFNQMEVLLKPPSWFPGGISAEQCYLPHCSIGPSDARWGKGKDSGSALLYFYLLYLISYCNLPLQLSPTFLHSFFHILPLVHLISFHHVLALLLPSLPAETPSLIFLLLFWSSCPYPCFVLNCCILCLSPFTSLLPI